ncbi:MAG: asparagine synthase (glutamine-hydrolyzing) [Gammaproteobacteria bacterium]
MCGIAGIASFGSSAIELDELKAMCTALRSRGPDDEGYYLDDCVGLGMRRLKVIDLKTGKQPVSNEDGSIVVILNGEIYNYRELRQDLQRRGHSFRTQSDTETIVHLYEDFGLDCVKKLRGMFSFALWDGKRKTLYLARDRIGIKPLYYAEVAGRFVFASELKAILQLPEVNRSLNWGSVNHLFAGLTTPPGESIVAGVHKLQPAHTLTLHQGKAPDISRYWRPEFEPDLKHDQAYFPERLRELLEESVRLHSHSDVPLGAFLSGGLDSSSIVAFMVRNSSRPISTFSIGFGEQGYDETTYARRVARHFDTEHHELILEPDIEGLVEGIAWDLDEPFGDSSAIPTYAVSKLAAKHVTVVLSGDGGDELFAGYEKYAVEERERRYDRIPASLRKVFGYIGDRMPEGAKGRNFLRHLALTGEDRYFDAGATFRPEQRTRLFQPDVAREIDGVGSLDDARMLLREGPAHWLSRLQYLDLHRYLPLDILTKVDRMSMAHSIEARVPLLDHKIVEFAASIPPELQRSGGVSKSVFKTAMRGILPDDIIDRPKQGFAVPLNAWFRGSLEPFVRDLLLSDTAVKRGIINPRYIERLLEMHAGGRNLDLQLWTLISFELWCRTFMDAPPGAPYGTRVGTSVSASSPSVQDSSA